jgi:molybdopterin biosynthesis enzyme
VTRFVGMDRDEVTLPHELIGVDAHLEGILASLPAPDPIELRVADGLGLVLAEPVVCATTVPASDNSAMDGFAVVASDLAGASRTSTCRSPARSSRAANRSPSHRGRACAS